MDYSTQKSDLLYGEWLYNLFKNGDFEQGKAGDFSDLPKGFTISTADSCEGKNHIKVNVNSGVYVKELKLASKQWHHLNYFIKSNKSGNSYIGLTFTKPDVNADFSNPSKLEITAFYPNATNKWYRDAFKFFTANYTTVYLVIYGGTNAFEIDDLGLFIEKTARAENPNNPTLLPEYDYEGDGVLFDEYDRLYGMTMVGENSVSDDDLIVNEDSDFENNGLSPSTGDTGYSLAVILLTLFFTSLVAFFVTKSKKGVK